ncbi:DNA translocase FtsK [Geobacillus sp. C56-T2]|uniref:DNA translocase FtsK n=1 Tax=Geobacillus sp. C56-T2 TaxID=600773 RepID=UPI0011A9EC4D|nr:DNA translocase FtsK [Geobacillus sp. C56-T2]NNV05987.1 DNA translocase FtsK [Geobacillus sp. MMMUD3]TWG31573.1 S-DNA-T family DNA segregation ATPase FtsK/SpoIIIE [Geobacillus sp. C56-T2]
MNWWKRWLRFWTGEEEREESGAPIRRLPSAGTFDEGEASGGDRYPQGRFRFPLIPDDPSSERREAPQRPEGEEVRNNVNRQRASGAMRREGEKRPFRPSDVPSPVFGYHKQKREQQEAVEERNAVSLAPERESARLRTALERGNVRPGGPSTAAEETEADKSAGSHRQPPNEMNDGSAQPSSDTGTRWRAAELGEPAVEEAVPNADRAPTEERLDESDGSAFVGEPAAVSPEVERIRIPYNVIMLQQDRRKLAEKTASSPNRYQRPPLALLDPPAELDVRDEQWLAEQCARLARTFESFHIGANVVGATQGPTVTQFEVQPDLGVKVSKITSLLDDIKLSLAAEDIRIEAPIPGKRTIGIEVPNPASRPVRLREILESSAFRDRHSPLTVALGLDISGAPVVTDIQKMPHGLIAGATGSGKSVCMNAMLVSMLYKAAPHEVKWLLIDPKMVELAPYNGLPHLLSPVITEAKAAAGALKWAVGEMERRYERFVHAGVRDIEKYNRHLHEAGGGEPPLPYIVIVIDELADLMMAAPADVEESICRLAQKARACGIHLLIATQRPSVDVITGLIKANIPTRLAFSVSSQVDSRTILDANGAERLLGRGDMLFLENGSAKPIRLQGCFISDEEIERVTAHVKAQQSPSYLFSPDDFRQAAAFGEEDDDLFDEACRFVIAQGGASTSSLQRHFRIGYNRAARLIEMMEEQGLISEARGSKPREVLMSEEEWERRRGQGG